MIHTARTEAVSKVGSGSLLASTFIAALGGLLFGYDTAVISGALGPMKAFFSLNDAQVGWAASSALVGCGIGSVIAGPLSQYLGRKLSMMIAGIFFAACAIGTAVPDTFNMFILYRIIGGVGVGLASLVSPMYISEIAPSEHRGRLVSLNQLAIVSGILMVYFVNYYIALAGDDTWDMQMGWRYMFGSELVPSLLFLGLLFWVPESPRWLVMKGRLTQAKKVLSKVGVPASKIQDEIKLIEKSFKRVGKSSQSSATKKLTWVIFLGVMLSVFQQVTGINVFLYYAPEIFKGFGNGTDAALFQTVLVGSVNLLCTFIAIYGVDRWGRKPLILVGSTIMGICLFFIGLGAYLQNTGSWLIVFVLGYIGAFALSLGPVVWVLLAEMFPNKVKSKAMAIAVTAQWIANFLVSQTFPMMMGEGTLQELFHGAFAFWLYSGMCLLTVIFTLKWIPETKGKSLEEIEKIWA